MFVGYRIVEKCDGLDYYPLASDAYPTWWEARTELTRLQTQYPDKVFSIQRHEDKGS